MAATLTFRHIAFGSAVAAAGIYTALVYKNISLVKHSDIINNVDHVAPSFRSSDTLSKLVNPRNFAYSASDSHITTIRLSPSCRDMTDEALLAHFVRGFFGGWVFMPERLALNALGFEFTKFSGSPATGRSSALGALAREELPAINTLLFGAFQVLDRNLEKNSHEAGQSRETVSHVDFAYGRDTSFFSGAHRFAIVRTPEDRKEGKVTVSFASASCNPTADKSVMPTALAYFHRAYAMLLFRESVAEVKRAAGDLGSS